MRCEITADHSVDAGAIHTVAFAANTVGSQLYVAQGLRPEVLPADEFGDRASGGVNIDQIIDGLEPGGNGTLRLMVTNHQITSARPDRIIPPMGVAVWRRGLVVVSTSELGGKPFPLGGLVAQKIGHALGLAGAEDRGGVVTPRLFCGNECVMGGQITAVETARNVGKRILQSVRSDDGTAGFCGPCRSHLRRYQPRVSAETARQ